MTEVVDLEKQKIKNLRICAATLGAISSGCALIPEPICKGVSVAFGLGAIITEYFAERLNANEEYNDSLMAAVAVR